MDRVILDVMDDYVLPKRRYPESFVLIFLAEVWQNGGSRGGGGTCRMLRGPHRRFGG